MKIGLMAYASNTGLGYQTLDFADYIHPSKILLVDISEYNKMPVDYSRFEGKGDEIRIIKGFPTDADCEWLVDDMDIVFVCETPLNYHLFSYAKTKGVKTIQQYNYEFLDYFRKPSLTPPDILAAPSEWGFSVVKNLNIAQVIRWPVPINTRDITPIVRQKVETFVHIAGRPAANDRNGTIHFLAAAIVLNRELNFKYKLYIQPPTDIRAQEHYIPILQAIDRAKMYLGSNLEVIENTSDRFEMYKSGDVLVLPRKYGGLCLPMLEAFAFAMPVIMTAIIPNNTYLPYSSLCKTKVSGVFNAHTSIVLHEADVDDLVNTMKDMILNVENASLHSLQIGKFLSWENQKQIYLNRFEEICK